MIQNWFVQVVISHVGGVGGQGGETYWAPFSWLLPWIQKPGVWHLCLASDERHMSSGLERQSSPHLCFFPSPSSPLVCRVQIPVGCQVWTSETGPPSPALLPPFFPSFLPSSPSFGPWGSERFLKSFFWEVVFYFVFKLVEKLQE